MGSLFFYGQGYSELIKRVATSPKEADGFGFSVDIDGHRAVVGAPGQDFDELENNYRGNAGAAYILERDNQGIWHIQQKIVAPVRAAFDYFGASVAIEGDAVVIGAWGHCFNELGSDSVFRAGAVYVYERSSIGQWDFQAKKVAPDRRAFDQLGKSVALSENYIFAGSFGQDYDANNLNYILDAGAVYTFANTTLGNFPFHQKLVANDRGFHDNFGEKIAVHQDRLVIGARFDNDDASGLNPLNMAGSAYVFEMDGSNNWLQVQKIVASDRKIQAEFGYDVAIEGNVIVIGAKSEMYDASNNFFFSNAGAAYVFERNGLGVWNQTQKLVASDRDEEDFFGFSVAISQGVVVIAASHDEHNATGNNPLSTCGSAYIFRKSGGVYMQTQKITHSDRSVNDHFGVEVAISGGYLLVGADLKNGVDILNNPTIESGSVYFFATIPFDTVE